MAVRASDADRDQVVTILQEQYAVGRLSLDEFQARSAASWSATTWGDLLEQIRDLPARPAFLTDHLAMVSPPPRPAPLPGFPGDPDLVLLIVLLVICPPAGVIYLLIRRNQSRRVSAYELPGGEGDAARHGLPPPGSP